MVSNSFKKKKGGDEDVEDNEDLEVDEDGELVRVVRRKVYFASHAMVVINRDGMDAALAAIGAEIQLRIDVWLNEDSGWAVESVDEHHINISKWNPLRGGTFMKLPRAHGA